jgi:flagellar capping protein FliD
MDFGPINNISDLDKILNDFIELVDSYNRKLDYLNELKNQMNILEKDANSHELILYDLKYGT